jgi:hypothetical protein
MVGTNGDDLKSVPVEPSAHADAVSLSTIISYTDAQSAMSHGGVKVNDWFSESEIQPLVKSDCNRRTIPRTASY